MTKGQARLTIVGTSASITVLLLVSFLTPRTYGQPGPEDIATMVTLAQARSDWQEKNQKRC